MGRRNDLKKKGKSWRSKYSLALVSRFSTQLSYFYRYVILSLMCFFFSVKHLSNSRKMAREGKKREWRKFIHLNTKADEDEI